MTEEHVREANLMTEEEHRAVHGTTKGGLLFRGTQCSFCGGPFDNDEDAFCAEDYCISNCTYCYGEDPNCQHVTDDGQRLTTGSTPKE